MLRRVSQPNGFDTMRPSFAGASFRAIMAYTRCSARRFGNERFGQVAEWSKAPA